MGQTLTNGNIVNNQFNQPSFNNTEPSRYIGYMGIFGNGRWRYFDRNGVFTVPVGVSQIRVRVLGGGSGCLGHSNISGDFEYSVPYDGQASSFGNLISATGGISTKIISDALHQGRYILVNGQPGVGIGGDFQAKGGCHKFDDIYFFPYELTLDLGGCSSGSQLGDGGQTDGPHGAGVGNNTNGDGVIIKARIRDLEHSVSTSSEVTRRTPRFPFDYFGGSSDNSHSHYEEALGGIAAHKFSTIANSSTLSGFGAGGGKHVYFYKPGLGGGDGNDTYLPKGVGGSGGGYAHGVFNVSPNQQFNVTVSRTYGNDYVKVNRGFVVVEW